MTERHAHQLVYIECAGLGTQPVEADRPGCHLERVGLTVGLSLVPAKLVSVVVVSRRVLAG